MLVAVTILAGCSRSPQLSQADGQLLCSMNGTAFYIYPGAGDTSFVKRAPTADALCRRLK
jgi:hypothetical protein